MSTFNQKFFQGQPFSLSGGGAIIGATSVILKSMTDIDGNALTMSGDFGTKGYGTLEPGNGTLEEQISFTGLTNNANGTVTLTGVKSVAFVYPYTETSGLLKTHAGSTSFVISNTAGFYNDLVAKGDDATITGKYTFPGGGNANAPVSGVSYTAPTADLEYASKKYVDNIAIAGAPDANPTTKGLVQLPTQAQVDAGTATGSTGASLTPTPALLRSKLLSDYVADTGAANAYVITPSPAITAYTAGQIFSFKAANTNTLTSTLNINGVGATTITRSGTQLGAGDITSGQIYMVEYDGTNFQLITPINGVPSGSIQMYVGATAPTAWLLCDGTSYLQATYPALFAVIGTVYGSADGTHFNVPDMRGRVAVGVGTGTGGGAAGTGTPTGGSALTAVARATWKGEETHQLTTPEIPAHTHTLTGKGYNAGTDTYPAGASATNGSYTTNSTGGDGAHNNIQPIMGVNFIIKT